jgi:hypothetical protein
MTENRVTDGRKASLSSANGAQMKVKKVRTPKSCDRCKSRKTKVRSASLNPILKTRADPTNSALIQVCPLYLPIERKSLSLIAALSRGTKSSVLWLSVSQSLDLADTVHTSVPSVEWPLDQNKDHITTFPRRSIGALCRFSATSYKRKNSILKL